jgi:glyoxylase-like metal-dependent hydrolase (beta-lactamase superfamily II)
MLELLSEVQILPVPSNTLPPARRTNAFLLGDEYSPKILIDPSPESPEVLEKLLRTLSHKAIDAVFLTHHHLDHHEHAPELAKRLNVPSWMSRHTNSSITLKQGSSYFSGIQIETKQEGDKLTEWKGEAVRVYSIPEHDSGHPALAPDSKRWFIVGDLIQNDGTVVISAPEGNITDYFQTLEKIIGIDPSVIIPSHGIPMRSTFQLHTTLKHRREREKTIQELYINGKTEANILEILYQGVEQHLRPFAPENIKAHLAKLKQESLI